MAYWMTEKERWEAEMEDRRIDDACEANRETNITMCDEDPDWVEA